MGNHSKLHTHTQAVTSTFELLETTFYVVFLPVMSHCSDLRDDMPVNNSLLNPPSKVEKMRDLGSNSERMMCSYVRLRTRRSDAWQRCASGCLKSWRNPQKGHTRRSKMLIPMMLQHITAVNWASCNDDGGFGKRDRGFRIRAERGQKERRPEGEEVSDHSLPVG